MQATVQNRSLPISDDLQRALGQSLVARVLANRGVTRMDEAELSLERLPNPTHIRHVDLAADWLAGAIQRQEPIVVAGDYDADGATSTALAVQALRGLGAKQVDFVMPDRQRDGYGLSEGLAQTAANTGARWLITVDNGIASHRGVAKARALGMRVIITDHHLPTDELPAADAIINPNVYASPNDPTRALAGVGVVYYLMLGLRAKLREQGHFTDRREPNLADYLDLVALGTIADLVPLNQLNRILVQHGLRRMRLGRARPGIQALLQLARRGGRLLSASDVSFAVAPRLNAAGRLADMSLGVRCLMASDVAQANELAMTLNSINAERRALQKEMTGQALAAVEADLQQQRFSLCLLGRDWHEGIIGIIAGRMRESTGLPAFALAPAALDSDGRRIVKGSGRSIEGVNLRDLLYEIDRRAPGLLLRFGGHAMAAGITLTESRVATFSTLLEQVTGEWLAGARPGRVYLTDGTLAASELSLANARQLHAYGPWGQGFPEPLFEGEFEILSRRALTETFFRYALRLGEVVVEAVSSVRLNDAVSRQRLLYRLGVNDYRQEELLQLRIEAIV